MMAAGKGIVAEMAKCVQPKMLLGDTKNSTASILLTKDQ